MRLKNVWTDEKGLTLVEVLASLVILSIVLSLFLIIFMQSLKASETSEEITDATYTAQTEMEKFYEQSRQGIKISEAMTNEHYAYQGEQNSWHVFWKETANNKIEMKLKLMERKRLRVLILVYDVKEENELQAQMENVLEWETVSNE